LQVKNIPTRMVVTTRAQRAEQVRSCCHGDKWSHGGCN